jgi:hypothetical protein
LSKNPFEEAFKKAADSAASDIKTEVIIVFCMSWSI